jgi:hypothetical protein
MAKSHENLKPIRFEGELLPKWAQLLDLAAVLGRVPADTRRWFSKLTNTSGVDDARTVIEQCSLLQASLRQHREAAIAELQRQRSDSQPSQILDAWAYALEVMIEEARVKKTCSWVVEGAEDADMHDSDGGDIELRRV